MSGDRSSVFEVFLVYLSVLSRQNCRETSAEIPSPADDLSLLSSEKCF